MSLDKLSYSVASSDVLNPWSSITCCRKTVGGACQFSVTCSDQRLLHDSDCLSLYTLVVIIASRRQLEQTESERVAHLENISQIGEKLVHSMRNRSDLLFHNVSSSFNKTLDVYYGYFEQPVAVLAKD